VPAAHQEAALIAQHLGRYEEAIAHFRAIIDGGQPDGFSAAAECRAWALYWLGQMCVTQGDRQQAIGLFERLIGEHADSKPGHYAYLELADACSKIGQYEKGIAALQSAVARYPGTETAGKAQWGIGQLLRAQGNLDQAKLAVPAGRCRIRGHRRHGGVREVGAGDACGDRGG
jgi:TolA-binding protein